MAIEHFSLSHDKNLSWVDLDIAAPEARMWLSQHTELDERTINLLLGKKGPNRRENLDEGVFFTLRVMAYGYDEEDDDDHQISLGIFLQANQMITTHQGPLPFLDHIRRQLTSSQKNSLRPAYCCAMLVTYLAERYEDAINDVVEETDDLEDQLEAEYFEDMVPGKVNNRHFRQVTILHRQVLQYRRRLNSLRNVLTFIASDPFIQIGKKERKMLGNAAVHLSRYLDSLEDCRSRAQLMREQLESRLASGLTRTTYKLTTIATVFLPLTFITGLLGINVAGIPESNNPYAFWLVCAVLSAIAILVWMLVNWRKRL